MGDGKVEREVDWWDGTADEASFVPRHTVLYRSDCSGFIKALLCEPELQEVRSEVLPVTTSRSPEMEGILERLRFSL